MHGLAAAITHTHGFFSRTVDVSYNQAMGSVAKGLPPPAQRCAVCEAAAYAESTILRSINGAGGQSSVTQLSELLGCATPHTHARARTDHAHDRARAARRARHPHALARIALRWERKRREEAVARAERALEAADVAQRSAREAMAA